VSISDADFTFRYQDYTTSLSTSTDEKVNKRSDVPKGGLISGGADKITSMKTEIVPFVDKNYKTNSDRGIFGHSFGVCLQLIVLFGEFILLDLASVVLHFGGTMRSYSKQLLNSGKIKLGIYRKLKFSFLLEIRSTLA
jgi:predicted alpha/beta superfamily hydrolase